MGYLRTHAVSRRIRALAHGHTVLAQELKVIPRSPIEALDTVHGTGRPRRGLSRWSPFGALVCAPLAVRIPGLAKVRIVVSFATEPPLSGSVVLVTNRLDWSAARIISLYRQRWPTETFYQDRQGHLGVNDYRLRRAEAIGKHWCLVFVASSLLHLTCLPAGPDRTKGLIQTMGDACRHQGGALLQRLLIFVHEQLSHGARVDHVFDHLFVKQRGMVPI